MPRARRLRVVGCAAVAVIASVLLPRAAAAADAGAASCGGGPAPMIPANAVFGEVAVDNGEVFDTDDPAESRRLYRAANRLHARTHAGVIERRLLFRAGDPWSLQRLQESERLLRETRYLYDAHICVLGYHDGVVDVSVVSRDVWTLRPGLSFGRSGGRNESGISLEDENLLGLGFSVSLDLQHSVDRDSTIVAFADRNFLGRWLTLETSFADNSDGRALHLTVDEPFYALATTHARGFRFVDDDRLDQLYEQGEVVDEFRAQTSYQRAYMGWSDGLRGGWARRWSVGLVRDSARFSPADEPDATTLLPEDRELRYPFVAFEALRDRFITSRNQDHIGRTEDFFLGPRIYAELGAASETFGSDRDALMFDALWSYGFQRTRRTRWLATTELRGRAEDGGGLANTVVSGRFDLYHQQSTRRLLFASATLDFARDLDLDNRLSIGGDNGLRGYPLRYQAGSRRALFTVEERYFTRWYPWRLFHVGGAAFIDVGRAWDDDPLAQQDLGWLGDIGIGARFGSSRSGTGTMVHVDLAMPLDGAGDSGDVQLVIETKHGF